MFSLGVVRRGWLGRQGGLGTGEVREARQAGRVLAGIGLDWRGRCGGGRLGKFRLGKAGNAGLVLAGHRQARQAG